MQNFYRNWRFRLRRYEFCWYMTGKGCPQVLCRDGLEEVDLRAFVIDWLIAVHEPVPVVGATTLLLSTLEERSMMTESTGSDLRNTHTCKIIFLG
jgi:hypothetical protein